MSRTRVWSLATADQLLHKHEGISKKVHAKTIVTTSFLTPASVLPGMFEAISSGNLRRE